MRLMKRSVSFVLVLLLFSQITAVYAEPVADFCCPYTEIWWGSTLDDVLALEGTPTETYDSIYGGLTYVFPKTYNALPGQIKYMFDAESELNSIAWMYSEADASAVLNAYETIYAQLETELGESGYQNANHTNAGGVWYTPHADILISMVSTQSVTALQYTYISPDASRRPE